MAGKKDQPIVGVVGPFFVAPQKAPAVPAVKRNEGYLLIRIHSAQAAFRGTRWSNWRNPIKQLLVTSQVQLLPRVEQPLRGIQVARPFVPGQTRQLGLRPNLIDFIPTTVERISVNLEFILDRGDRLQALAGAINDSGFLSALSLAEPTLAAAKAVGNASRQILDAFLSSEDKTPILQFTGDFTVGTEDLRAGYYVLLGSVDSEHPLPSSPPLLEVSGQNLLVDGRPAEFWSYIILEVICAPVRERTGLPEWDRLLREAEDAVQALQADPGQGEEQIKAAGDKCRTLIAQAQALLRVDANYLPREASDIIKAAYKQVAEGLKGAGASRGKGQMAAVAVADAQAAAIREALELPDEQQVAADVARYAQQVRTYRVSIKQQLDGLHQEAERARKQAEAAYSALATDAAAPANPSSPAEDGA